MALLKTNSLRNLLKSPRMNTTCKEFSLSYIELQPINFVEIFQCAVDKGDNEPEPGQARRSFRDFCSLVYSGGLSRDLDVNYVEIKDSSASCHQEIKVVDFSELKNKKSRKPGGCVEEEQHIGMGGYHSCL
ncbi:hypothetical protein GQ457_18G012920 [Hibiscus cannabinus]